MSYDTLVLNADGAPLSIVPLSTLSWQESIKLIYLDRADALHFYDDWVVRSPSIALPVPSVIILKEYIRAAKAIKYNRNNVLLRDEYHCMYCNDQFPPSQLTLDHVVPRAEGGRTKWENVSAACSPCNLEKAHHHDMRPRIHPYRPTYYELVDKRKKFPQPISHVSWAHYVGWDADKVVVRHKHK